MELCRCPWVGTNELMVRYHDEEWGVPVHDEARLFEMLCLEGAQAGLSWQTILNKREGYRRIFHQFDVERVAAMSDAELEQALLDPAIVRHRGKIASVRDNAHAILRLRAEGLSLATFLWSFVNGQPLQPVLRDLADYASRTPESDAMSKALVKRGFRFVGSTTCYAFMQACGMTNDHTQDCFRKASSAA